MRNLLKKRVIAAALITMGFIASMSIPALNAAVEFHGNSESYKFHREGCRWYNCGNCTVVFHSREAAIKAGFVPCKVCKP